MYESPEDYTFDNGLKLLCMRKASAPIVAVHIWYRTGSANEHDGVRGISHFFEHMMFRGSERVGPEEHAKRINDVGGYANAFTTEDATAYTNSVPREHLSMVLELEAERMRNLRVTQEVLDTERRVILEEYHTYMNNPVAKAFLEFRREFFGSHPYAIGPLGELDDIRRITVDDCHEYYQRWYRPSNATLVVVGDIDSTEAVKELVATHFGGFDGGPTPEGPVDMSFERAPGRSFAKRVDFDVPVQMIGYPAPASRHSDGVALDILQQVISMGETSRLNRSLVRDQGLAVLVGGANLMLKHAGISLLFAAFTPDMRATRVEQALCAEVERVSSGGVSEAEMAKVRNMTLAMRTFEMYSGDHLAQRLGFAEVIEGDYRRWVERLETLRTITAEQVVETARKYWSSASRWSLSLQPRRRHPLLHLVGLGRRIANIGRRKAREV
ncbi:MAG: hypothetical protein GF331_25860 [Chitinivibrionales bacterium]|nr:hypothetical protein [Chitinivibrionales bacterium]